MSGASFGERLQAAVERAGGPLCVGIDPRPPFPDECLRGLQGTRSGLARGLERYCLGLVEAVAPVAAAVKPQVAFFELYGGYGLHALDAVCARARELGLLVVADAKRGDIASTAAAYAEAWIGIRPGESQPLADAVTVNAYMGRDSVLPFLATADRHGSGIFVLTRTSNPGAADLEERLLEGGRAAWTEVAGWIDEWNRERVGAVGVGPVGAVVGATAPAALSEARCLMPTAPLLVPGLGAQGGTPADLAPAFAHGGAGLAVAARSIVEAWRPAPEPWADAVAAAAAATQQALAVALTDV